MSHTVLLRSFVVTLVLASVPLARSAAAATGCRYRAGDAPARVHVQPYRTARTVGVLQPGRSARGACGRVWNGAHEWTRLDRPVSGYVASGHVRRR